MSDDARAEERWENLKARLARSAFRTRFALRKSDLLYVQARGADALREHARRFVAERLAPAVPRNDGHQTPMRGHPVFVAQHATGTCCRRCLKKWHGVPEGSPLSLLEQDYVVDVVMRWIVEQSYPHVLFEDAAAYAQPIPFRPLAEPKKHLNGARTGGTFHGSVARE